MNSDDFEKRVQSQPMRQVPVEWRQEILSAALQAAAPQHATRNTQQAHAAPSLLSTFCQQLSAILWPHPAAWAGLAAVWLLIAGLSLSTRTAAPQLARRTSPLSPQVVMAFREQEQVLAELIGPPEAPAAMRPKPAAVPQPRSEYQQGFLAV
jgi:hypothetical protein